MLRRILTKWWPILPLLAIEIILVATNFTPNTYVVGWDNMFPEFNFSLNLGRTLSSVWQEYRGLGVMDGMSHAANLVHYVFLWILSFVVPQQLLRYVYIFLTHLAGGIGMYVLVTSIANANKHKQLLGITGAIVYQYCFATIQMYYLPFEVFITHFAALPWLVYSLIQYLTTPTKHNGLLFAGISLLSTPQAHVPTVFIVYLFVFTIITMTTLVSSRMRSLKASIIALLITIGINAFWGLPFTYATLRHSNTITESKNNQMATEDTFLKNREFGNLGDVATMKSFSVRYMQYDHTTNTVDFMLLPWITHQSSPVVTLSMYLLFGLAIIGLVGSLTKGASAWKMAATLYLLSVFFIGNDIVGIKQATDVLRQHIPLFSDVFRFVFTKFFILFALSTSLMVVYGIITLATLVTTTGKRAVYIIFSLLTICIVGVTTIPSFTGNFLFKNLRVDIPTDYTNVFSFFNQKPTTQRVLIYPMPWYWAWTQYRWGVIGSGFTWFGISQPTIDRAFDPWSDKNENIYWELSQAVYEENAQQFESILSKYDISWILFDEHIIHAVNDKALYMSSFEDIVATLPSIQKETQFGRISIYSVTNPASPLSLVSDIPNIGPSYTFTDHDEAATNVLPYITDDTKPFDRIYPFRSLFTGRDQQERAYDITTTANTVTINTETIPLSKDSIVFDSQTTHIFSQPLRSCDTLRNGISTREHRQDNAGASFERFTSTNASTCIELFLPSISHRNGYILEVVSRHMTGRRLSLSITNSDTKRTFVETFVTGKHQDSRLWTTSYFTIPPMNAFGMGYTMTFDNLSIGSDTTTNDIQSIRIIQIPYNTLVTTTIEPQKDQPQQPPKRTPVTTLTHPNAAVYTATIDTIKLTMSTDTPNTLFLSQAYDEGWMAYIIQNNHIRQLTHHVLVNNWANGWVLDQQLSSSVTSSPRSATLVIIFLPQLLQWAGLILIPLVFLFMIQKAKP